MGGDSVTPRILTLSFPGFSRGLLFEQLKGCKLKLGNDSDAEVHAMNDNSKNTGLDAVPFPETWASELNGLPQLSALQKHIQSIKVKKSKYKPGTAPSWFALHWGLAAWHTAQNSQETGSGVVIFKGWVNYTKSPWCKLEFLFCQCLVERFGKCVYVVDRKKSYYMEGTEKF